MARTPRVAPKEGREELSFSALLEDVLVWDWRTCVFQTRALWDKGAQRRREESL